MRRNFVNFHVTLNSLTLIMTLRLELQLKMNCLFLSTDFDFTSQTGKSTFEDSSHFLWRNVTIHQISLFFSFTLTLSHQTCAVFTKSPQIGCLLVDCIIWISFSPISLLQSRLSGTWQNCNQEPFGKTETVFSELGGSACGTLSELLIINDEFLLFPCRIRGQLVRDFS